MHDLKMLFSLQQLRQALPWEVVWVDADTWMGEYCLVSPICFSFLGSFPCLAANFQVHR